MADVEGGVVEGAGTEDDFTLVKRQFEQFADASRESRQRAERCRDYKDGNQWTDSELATLRKRKQPVITDNKLQDKCNALQGIEKRMRTDPKAYPRTPEHDEDGEAATDALRFVADQNDFQRSVRSLALDNLMVEGLCAGEVVVDRQTAKVEMRHIRWDRVYYDPHSLKADFSDKRFCGFFTWMDQEEAKTEWPGKLLELENSSAVPNASGDNETHDDRPRYAITTGERKRLQIFEHYWKRGASWYRGVWVKGGWLEEPIPSAYLNEFQQPDCCIELQAVYRDRDGDPYGTIARYMDLQDEHNKRRSKMMHALTTRQIVMERGAADPDGGVDQVRAEIHKPDGVIEVNRDFRFEVLENTQLTDGQWRLMVYTAEQLEGSPNAALMGESGSVSGRAKQIDQDAGMLEVTPLFEALSGWQLRMFRHAWNRIRQYWTGETWVRVTDDEKGVKFVGLNQPISRGEAMAEALKKEQVPEQEKAAMLEQIAADPTSQEPAINAQTGEPMIRNSVAEMDVDIILDEAPDIITVQQEQFEGLLALAERRPDIPTQWLIEASSLRNKKQLIDHLTGENDPAAAQMAQMQQAMQELALQLQQATVLLTEAQAADEQASAVHHQASAVALAAKAMEPPPQPKQNGKERKAAAKTAAR